MHNGFIQFLFYILFSQSLDTLKVLQRKVKVGKQNATKPVSLKSELKIVTYVSRRISKTYER